MGEPKLIESVGFYNLVQLDDHIFGLPMGLGPIELKVEEIEKKACAYVEKTAEEVKEKIYLNNAISKEKYGPIFLRVYGFYNIVAWGVDLYGIPVSIGEVDLNSIRISEYPGIIESSNMVGLIAGIEEYCRMEHRKKKPLVARENESDE